MRVRVRVRARASHRHIIIMTTQHFDFHSRNLSYRNHVYFILHIRDRNFKQRLSGYMLQAENKKE